MVTGSKTNTGGTEVTGIRSYPDYSITISSTANEGIYYVPDYYNRYISHVGTAVDFKIVENKEKKVIHPRLYFKFVKSKLNKLEERKLNDRLLKLQKFVVEARELGQQALYEEFARKIAITVREQELWACGVEYFVNKDIITRFMDRVKDAEIKLVELKKYNRPIPDLPNKRIKRFKKLKMFDKFWVLYLDYKDKKDITGQKKSEEVLKTNKQKIKEKDPIIFGSLDYLPDQFYFIADWVDEYCDLTLDKFVADVKSNAADYELDRVADINEKLIKKLVKESRERFVRLKKTNPGNYKKLMKKEELVNGE